MGYQAMGRLHAELFTALHAVRSDDEGQGTVEYVALMLLLGGIFAAVVSKGGGAGIGDKISGAIGDNIKSAINKAVDAGKGAKAG
jgi:hypothetical protein